jgi:hypothetical protein
MFKVHVHVDVPCFGSVLFVVHFVKGMHVPRDEIRSFTSYDRQKLVTDEKSIHVKTCARLR